jgi:hypothetical protein
MATTYNRNQKLQGRLPRRTYDHLFKTIYIIRNIRLQKFQRGGNPHLSQLATRRSKSKLHQKQPAPWNNRQPEQLHHVTVLRSFKVNCYMFRTSPLSYNLTFFNIYFFDFCVLNLSAVQLPFKLAASNTYL